MRIKRKALIRAKVRRANSNHIGLFVRLTMEGIRKEIALGITLNINEWDDRSQMVIERDDADYLNQSLRNSLRTLEEIFVRYELVEQKLPTIDDVIWEFNESDGRGYRNKFVIQERVISPFESFADFIKDGEIQKSWAYSTIRKFNTFKKHLYQWNENLQWDAITTESMYEFQHWCRIILDHQNTTLQKQASFIRWWLHWASEKGLYQGDAHKKFFPKYKGGNFEAKEIVYLTSEELKQLEEYDFCERATYDHVRDCFIFSCFSGLRYSDIKKLKKADVKGGKIKVVTQKTTESIFIDLNKHTRRILEKYDGWHPELALPCISNTKMNKYLKNVCKVVGLERTITDAYFIGNLKKEISYKLCDGITFHCGRRTFTTQAFALGIPPSVIVKFTGHKKLDMLKPYMKIVDSIKADEMKKFDEL